MTAKIDKFALAKRFLKLGQQEQEKFISLLAQKGISFEKLPIVAGEEGLSSPLSPVQQGIWDIYQLDSGNSAYHISGGFELTGNLDVERMEQAFSSVTRKHHSLRTRFIQSSEAEVNQYIDLQSSAFIEKVDGRHYSSVQIEAAISDFISKPFDLYHQIPVRMCCIRIEDNQTYVLISMHHIVSDGWSIDILMKDLTASYHGEELLPLDIQYSDYSRWQSALLGAGKGAKDLEFWRQELGTVQPEKLFDWNGVTQLNQRREAAQINLSFARSITEKIESLARQNNVTTSSLWLTLWQVALSKCTGRADINIGMPMANRSRPEISEMIGFFVNTNVVGQIVSPEQSFSALLSSSHHKVLEIQGHQFVPFDRVVAALLEKRNLGETPYFQVLFNHQVVAIEQVDFSEDIVARPIQIPGNLALFDVALDIRESVKGTEVTLTYAKDRIVAETMELLGNILTELVVSCEENINRTIAAIDPLSEEERNKLMVLSQPEGSWIDGLVVDMIDKQCLQQPLGIALKHGENQVTFKQLEQRSNQIAHYLIDQGVGRDNAVGVLFERGCDMIVSMLAVMKAGGAFLPLDPDYPLERLAYMLEDSGAKIVITSESLNQRMKQISSEVKTHSFSTVYYDLVCWQNLPLTRPNVNILPEQLAYIIYTSGSTGRPKGVSIAHDGLNMHVQTIGAQYGMTREDIELHFASISFDGAVERWTVPLAFGARLIIRDQQLWSVEKTCQVLQEEQVTIACFPPSYVGPLLDWIEQTQTRLSLRSWTLGGEAFTRETYDRLRAVVNPPRVINGYGPTETVVTPMIWRAYPDDSLTSAYAPIGRPVGHRRLYVLDEQLNKVASGAVGELYIGGEIGLARGYLHKPEMTVERFLPDPFLENGERMYRTGDLVRWREDDVMEYFGRVDQQIKIRGFRVELGEIEARLQKLCDVESCFVTAHEYGSRTELVGYLNGKNAVQVDTKSVIEALAKELPDYMVPSHLMIVETLPLTPAGKVDRKALPRPNVDLSFTSVTPPKGEREKLIADIWRSLLGEIPIGREDSFFALGGNSILTLQLVSKLKIAGFHVSPKEVFSAHTLKELASAITIASGQEQRELTKKPFPLMPIQAHFMAQSFAEPNHWNQHVCVELKQEMDLIALKEALNTLVVHHPALRLSFSEESGKWQQRFSSEIPENILWQTQAESMDDFYAFADELQTSLNISSGKLIQAGYAKIKEKKSRFMIVIHHLAVDGVSWRILMDDLWRAYQQVLSEQPVVLPQTFNSLDLVVDKIHQWQFSDESQSRQKLWQEQVLPNQQRHSATYIQKRSLNVTLSRSTTARLLRSNNITAELVAALTVMVDQSKQSMQIFLESHGRDQTVYGDLDLSRMVGWMTNLYPMILKASDTREDIDERMQRLNQDSGISFLVRYLDSNPIDAHAEITFNYLGQYQENSFAHWCQPVSSGSEDQAPSNMMLTPMTINAHVIGGLLSAEFIYASSCYSDEEVESLSELWRHKIELLDTVEKDLKSSANLKLIEQLNTSVDNHLPIFCIHPSTGRTQGYQKLAQSLDGHRVVFGLQSQSFVNTGCFDDSFSMMADTYFHTIRKQQPEGPYTLIGWSLGGALCQEVAARLEAIGETIEHLILLDCYIPGTEIMDEQWSSPKAKLKFIQHLEILLGTLAESQKKMCLDGLDGLPSNQWPEFFSTWLREQNFAQYLIESAEQMLYSWAVEQHMRFLCKGYSLPSIKTQPVAYWAGIPSGRDKELISGLSKVNRYQTSETFNTDHFGIVQLDEVIHSVRNLVCKQ